MLGTAIPGWGFGQLPSGSEEVGFRVLNGQKVYSAGYCYSVDGLFGGNCPSAAPAGQNMSGFRVRNASRGR